MKHDDLIDDVARRMTTLHERPALRARVLARMDTLSSQHGRRWMIAPVLGTAALLVIVAGWTLRSSNVEPDIPVVERVARASLPVSGNPSLARRAPTDAMVELATSADRNALASNLAGRVRARAMAPVLESSRAGEWATALATADVPMLPPLAPPDPIVITDLEAHPMAIAPMALSAVEISRLVIEPLSVVDPLSAAATGGAL